MADSTKSYEQYVQDDQNITVKKDGSTVTTTVNAGASKNIVAGASSDNWVISGTSNYGVKSVATGTGNDKINFGATTDLAVNVGTGRDSVQLGDGSTVVGVSISGGSGDKVIGINGNLDPSYISLQSGNHLITISGALLDSSVITAGGRDTVTIGAGAVNGIVNTGAGNDSVLITGDVDSTSIDLGNDRDSLEVAGTPTKTKATVKYSTINGGDGADYVNLIGVDSVNASTINLGAGKDTLDIGGAIVDTNIDAGADADVVTLTGASYSNINLGDGNDFIALAGGTNAYHDVSIQGGTGKDTFYVSDLAGSDAVNITDYDVLNDVIEVGSLAHGYTADGQVTLTAATSVTASVGISKTGDYYAAQIKDAVGQYYVAWGDGEGSAIDIRDWTKETTIYGTVNNDAADLIIGGKKNDTVYVGANDSVYGGAGNDVISIAGSATNTQEFVGLSSAGGKDTVTGFTTKSTSVAADEADVLNLFDSGLSSLKMETVTGGALVAKVGNGSVQLRSSARSEETFNVTDSNGTVAEVNFVAGTANIPAATDEFADFYYAGTSAASLNFGNVDSELVVDLGNRNLNVNGTSLVNTDNAFYYGKFASATGGKDSTVLMGAADAKETLTAGAGDTTIWGGGKKADSLVHGSGTTNSVKFFFGEGDGADTINSSNWGDGDTADVLWLGATAKAIKNDGSKTTVTMKDGSKATVTFSATDTAIKFTTDGSNIQQAKLGTSSGNNTWTYSEGVSFYMGGKKNTLNVTSSVDEANIWLDGSNGKHYEGVSVVNAGSNNGVVTLAGSAASESLIAGTGTSSLWGGAGNANDTLTGNSTGNTTFFFGKGEGKDVISNSNSDDKVVLYNVALNDVAGFDDTKSGVLKINLNDGSSLTVNRSSSNSVNTFQLSDGSVWKYDASTTDKWVKG